MKNSTLFESAYFELLVNAYRVNNEGISEDTVPPPIPLEGGSSGEPPSPKNYLLPSVIIWDPANQLACFKNGIPCPHDSHHTEKCFLQLNKKGRHFKTGKGGKELPRPLYGSEGVTFLVSRVYSCKIGHKIIAHDARILEMIPDSAQIPFVLFHRMGVTRELATLIRLYIFSGMTFSEIGELVGQRYRDKYSARRNAFEKDIKAHVSSSEVEAFPDFNPAVLPSVETMMTTLVEDFQGLKVYYNQRMSEWSAKCITAGHLFKVRTTIGEKTAENKWITHFDALYTVINEMGQVIAWQLTNKKSLDDVTGLLTGLQERLEKREQHLDLALVPDCCDAREKFTAIFGVDVPVKLDPAKAIHMVMRKIPEKKRRENQLTKSCIRDFAMVFRRSTDHGDERCEETPSPEEILNNLNSFLRLYKHMTEETGERVFPLSASRQVDQLKLHIEEGCVSGIPSGSGSEKTEELHSILKPVLEKKFLSRDVAIPLLSTLFYVWNERKASQLPKGAAIQSVSSYKASLELSEWEPTTEVFGAAGLDSTVPMEGDYTFDVRALRVLIAEALGETKEIHTDNIDNSEVGKQLTDSQLKDSVLTKAANYDSIQKKLATLRRNPNFPSRLMHLLPCAVLLFSRHECIVGSSPSHDETLDKTLDLYSLSLADASGLDGFFEAVASGLNLLLAEDTAESEKLKSNLSSIGYSTGEGHSLEDDVLALRQIISKEWLSNHEDYHKLLVSPLLDFKEEAQNFSQCGYYKAEMANLLPLSAAKVLQVPIILFTSLEHFPVVPVVPTDVITSSNPILVAYSALGCGTFYSVKALNSAEGTAIKQAVTTSAAGAGSDESGAFSETVLSGSTDIAGIAHTSEGKSTFSNNTGAGNNSASFVDDGSSAVDGKTVESSKTPEDKTGDSNAADESMTENDSSMNADLTAEDINTTAENSVLDDSSIDAGVESSKTPEDKTGDSNAADESMTENDSSTNADVTAEDINTTAENSVLDDSSIDAGDTEMTDNTNSADGNPRKGGTKENGNVTESDGVVSDNAPVKMEQGAKGNSSIPGTQQSTGDDQSAPALSRVALKRMYEAARKRKWRRSKQCIIKLDKSKPIACGCGRGAGHKNKDRKFCVQTDPSQRMRCDCYREGVGCSYNCRCIRCANPFGTCDEAKAKCPRPRPHSTQRLRPKYKVQAIKSHFSAHLSGAYNSAWSEIESLAFEHLLDLMAYTGLEPTKENIASEYEHLVKVANEEGVKYVTSKASAELSQQFDVVHKSMQTFENLYKKQTELNWFQGITEVCCMEVETS